MSFREDGSNPCNSEVLKRVFTNPCNSEVLKGVFTNPCNSEVLKRVFTNPCNSEVLKRVFTNPCNSEVLKRVFTNPCNSEVLKRVFTNPCNSEVLKRVFTNPCNSEVLKRVFTNPCNSEVLKRVFTKSGTLKLYPHKVYCYKNIIKSLQCLLSRPGFATACESTRGLCHEHTAIYSDVYHGQMWKDVLKIEGQDFLAALFCYGLMLNIDWFQPYMCIQLV